MSIKVLYHQNINQNIYLNQILEICTSSKYSKWYDQIISKGLLRIESIEGEKHHILPKSFKLGGEKDKQNIVKLTYREHFIVHLLLARMFSEKRKHLMIYAIHRLSTGLLRGTTKRCNPYASKRFALHRKICVNHMKNHMKEVFQKHYYWINNGIESKRIISKDLDFYLSSGWSFGRLYFNRPKIQAITNGKENKRVTFEELDSYIKQGWIKGKFKTNQVTITNGKNNLRVDPDKIPGGFSKGSCLKASTNRTWCNNGIIETYTKPNEEIPTGFIKGRLNLLKFAPKNRTLRLWINNGVDTKVVSSIEEVPVGWKLSKRSKLRKDPAFQALL